VIEDLRHAAQQLSRQRGAALTVIVVLAITAGVTAASFDVMAAFLWRPLPYPASDRLVVVDYPRLNGPSPRDLTRIDGSGVSSFAELTVASDPDSFTVLGGDEAPFTVDGRWTSGDVFAMFGVAPVLGRTFTREEAARGDRVALIGHHIWLERFGGRADIIGRPITVRATIRQGEPEIFTIAGVLPPRFWHVEDRTSLILPLTQARLPWLMRLRDGVTPDEAGTRITAMVRQQLPAIGSEWSALVRSARDAHVDRVRPMLAATGWGLTLLAAVALANLTFLQMARGVRRQRESAVRVVLGASRRALARQIAAESLVCGAIAGAGAVVISTLLLRTGVVAVEQYLGRVVPDAFGPGRDPWLLVVTPLLTIAASLALGAILFVVSTGATPATALAGNASTTDTPARLILRQAIVATQVAVAFCLLVGATLMVRTAWHLGNIDVGFEPHGVLSANLTLPERTYRSLDQRREFFRKLTARLEQLPEISEAGLTGWLPFRIGPAVTIEVEGEAAASPAASLQGVNEEYFSALGMRLLEGRWLNAGDRAGRENAAVISRGLARAWGSASPLGRKFRIKFSPEPGRGFGPYTVVGVADEVMQSVMNVTPPQLYLSFYQQPIATNAFLHLKTRTAPMDAAATVARVVRDLDPELALGSVNSLDAIVHAEGLRPRLLARALAGFALLAMVIAAIGLYAVSAWIAQLRRREAALRVALGAGRASVATLLARRGLIAIGGGLIAGWLAAAPMSAAIASELRGVAASDASTRLMVTALLTTVSVVALFGPAWRASRGSLAALMRDE
jgi:putative ABC transport system permease protein